MDLVLTLTAERDRALAAIAREQRIVDACTTALTAFSQHTAVQWPANVEVGSPSGATDYKTIGHTYDKIKDVLVSPLSAKQVAATLQLPLESVKTILHQLRVEGEVVTIGDRNGQKWVLKKHAETRPMTEPSSTPKKKI